MGTVHFLGERPPVAYVVRVIHHHNGVVEIEVDGVGDSPDDRRKISQALLEAAAMVESADRKG